MSYGWLTESSLIPKPAVPINVESSSLNDLKLALMKQKDNQVIGITKSKQQIKNQKVQNKGLEERMKRDLQYNPTPLSQSEIDESTRISMMKSILKKKSEIYEKQQQTGLNLKSSLIDFSLKQINDMSDKDKMYFNNQIRTYEEERQQFYQSKKLENLVLQQNLIGKRPQIPNPKLGLQQSQQELERAQWEERMLKEIENDIKETEDIKKNIIEQAYDKKLTTNEKNKLEDVVKETQQARTIQFSYK